MMKGYAVGSATEPGSYLMLNGNYLCHEGSFEVQSVDEFEQVCQDLLDMGWECDFALVETDDESGDKSIIAWS